MTPKEIGRQLQILAPKAPMYADGPRFEARFDNLTVRCDNSTFHILEMADKFLKAPAILESHMAREIRRESSRDYARREPRHRLAARHPELTFL